MLDSHVSVCEHLRQLVFLACHLTHNANTNNYSLCGYNYKMLRPQCKATSMLPFIFATHHVVAYMFFVSRSD